MKTAEFHKDVSGTEAFMKIIEGTSCPNLLVLLAFRNIYPGRVSIPPAFQLTHLALSTKIFIPLNSLLNITRIVHKPLSHHKTKSHIWLASLEWGIAIASNINKCGVCAQQNLTELFVQSFILVPARFKWINCLKGMMLKGSWKSKALCQDACQAMPSSSSELEEEVVSASSAYRKEIRFGLGGGSFDCESPMKLEKVNSTWLAPSAVKVWNVSSGFSQVP